VKTGLVRLLSICFLLFSLTPASAIENGEIALDAPVVGLTFGESGGIFCSGAMIESRIVVTAHHCLPEAGGVPDLLTKISISVTSPGANISDSKTERAKVIAIVSKNSAWSIGECEKGFCEDLDDLMFFILDKDFKVPSNLKIAAKDDILKFRGLKSPVTTFGYGKTTYGGRIQNAPLKMTGELDEPNPGGYGSFTFNVKVKGNQNICSGDSGGPNYVTNEGTLYYLGPTSGTRRPSCIQNAITDNGYYGGTAVAFKEDLLEEARSVARKIKINEDAELKAKQDAEAKNNVNQNNSQIIDNKKVLIKKTITCIKGKLTKKVTAINPICPAGFKKK
jgi:hypothetical protein